MPRVKTTVLRTTAGNRPARVVGVVTPIALANPITSFAIPCVSAECSYDARDPKVTFGIPEEIEVVHPETQETYATCRIAVTINNEPAGYIPLPLRYRETWLDLSYNIILYVQMWRLWANEEEKTTRKSQKAKFLTLRQNTGAVAAQHTLARLLAIEELLTLSLEASEPGKESVRILDEWRVRWYRDWFNSTYSQVVNSGAKFLNADPIHQTNRAFFETDWSVPNESKNLFYAPADLTKWFNGEIDFLKDMFEERLKNEAIEALKKPNEFSDRQFDPKVRLPRRWHEAQKPLAHFWSVEQWDWVAEGNSMWSKPTELLFHSLKVNPAQTFHQFKQLLDSILANLQVRADPQTLHELVTDLWMGEMIWRKFAEKLLKIHIPQGVPIPPRWERIDAANPFNTVEARMVLQGCLRRKDASASQMSIRKDAILWKCIPQMSQSKHGSTWEWIVQQVDEGQEVQDVLNMARDFWLKEEKRGLAGKAKGGNAGASSKKRGGRTAAGGDSGESELDQDMEEEENEERSGQATAEGGPSNTQDTAGPSTADQIMGDVENDGHSASTGRDNNAAAGNQSTVSSQGLPWTGESAAHELERYPALTILVNTFTTFMIDQNIQVLEATLNDLVPATRRTSVDHLMARMRESLLDDAMWNPSRDFKEFYDGEMAALAAQAREEAVQAQNRLL